MVNIRVMTIEDYDGIYDLWINTPGMGLNSTDDSREGIEKYIKRNPTSCFVAEDNDKIVGVIIAGHDGRRGYATSSLWVVISTSAPPEAAKLRDGDVQLCHSRSTPPETAMVL